MIDEDAIRQRWEAVGSKLDERGQRLFPRSRCGALGGVVLRSSRRSPGWLVRRSIAGRLIWLRHRCRGVAFAFWDYLGARLAVPGCQEIPALAEIVSARAPRPP